MASAPLRVGYVPEHFCTPIHFAREHFGLDAELVPFPSGTGHMITALRSNEIDVGIGLTEGWVAGLGKEEHGGDGGYRLVGTYVETPLCWAISTGAQRADITTIESLSGRKIGVSRLGSGSYVMGFVLADQQAWLPKNSDNLTAGAAALSLYSDIVVLDTFEKLRKAVNTGEADFFMWENFTSKRYYDSGEIRKVGEIYTPWSSWKIVARTKLVRDGQLDPRLHDLFGRLDKGIKHFGEHKEEAVSYISTHLGYSEEDAREWLKTVRFPDHTEGVDITVIEKTVATLHKAGVLSGGRGMEPSAMIARQR